jgi:hypothetical protein
MKRMGQKELRDRTAEAVDEVPEALAGYDLRLRGRTGVAGLHL